MPSTPSDPSAAVQQWLNNIIHNIDLAQAFAVGIEFDAFRTDLLGFYAVTRCLEITSEASRGLLSDPKARHPTIAWKEMAAAGNIYRHEYEDVFTRRVWATLCLPLPPLRVVAEHELAILANAP